LKGSQQESRRAPVSLIGQALNHFVAVANVLCHRVIKARLVRIHFERHPVRLPAAKDLVALRIR